MKAVAVTRFLKIENKKRLKRTWRNANKNNQNELKSKTIINSS